MPVRLRAALAATAAAPGPPFPQVLGALVSVMMVWVITLNLLLEAVRRLVEPEPVNGKGGWGEGKNRRANTGVVGRMLACRRCA